MAAKQLTAIVPARRGSRGIPGKNRKLIAGKPLVSWVVSAALKAETVDRVVVPTDDPAVAAIVAELGAEPVDRSPESSTDEAPSEAVLLEATRSLGLERFVLLQPTSPLTTADDIDQAAALHLNGGFDSVVSVAPQSRFVWIESGEGDRWEAWNYDPRLRPRRQEAAPMMVENGAIYVTSAALLERERSRLGGRIGVHVMPPETYTEADEPADWAILAELLIERRRRDANWAAVKLVLTDVDGVLTDNGMYWSSDGAEMKRFSARDGKGFELLHKAGLETALLTSERLELVARRGEKLGSRTVELGCADKVAAAERIIGEIGLDWAAVAYIGDDLHDLGLLTKAGSSFAPADAIEAVRNAVGYVLDARGGQGCFREVADLLLDGQRG